MTKTLAVIAVATIIAVTAHTASAQMPRSVPNAAPMQPYQQLYIHQFQPPYQPHYQLPYQPRLTTNCTPKMFGGFSCTAN